MHPTPYFTPTLEFAELRESVLSALRAWRVLSGTADDFLSHLLLVQEQRKVLPGNSPPMLRRATNEVLLACIRELEKQDPLGAGILQARFPDQEYVSELAPKLSLTVNQVKKRQSAAVSHLTRILLERELAARRRRIQEIEDQLPRPSYTEFIGLAQTVQLLCDQLLSEAAPWIIAIIGIGGIGKTSLADHVVRTIVPTFHFREFIWLNLDSGASAYLSGHSATTTDSFLTALGQHPFFDIPEGATAKQRNLQLRQMMKETPCLVVIDNLEVEADIVSLLSDLQGLANPSKFVLTTRTHPQGQIGVFHLPLSELSFAEAEQLIREHARSVRLRGLSQITKEEVATIYRVTGGNPLAIKLVIGMTTRLPIQYILNDLVDVQSSETEEMYRHIYWQAWRSLTSEARTLLEAMPVATQVGVTLEHLLAISGLTQRQLGLAIKELTDCSLLEVRGTAWETRYGIHRLTETFLRSEIIHWPDDTL